MSRPPSDPGLPQDPHLRAALRHAPDAQAQAPAALSARILDAAREQAARQAPPAAAAPRARPAPAPWWKRLLGGDAPGRGAGPAWASGLALLFVTLVAGLIWLPERPDVDIQPPRPQAQTEHRAAGPDATTGGEQQAQAKKPASVPPQQETRRAPAATAGTLAKARERSAQPAMADKQDGDRPADAAPKPRPGPAGEPAPVTAAAHAGEAAETARRAAPPPAPPTPAAAQAPPARKQAAADAAGEDGFAFAQEAEEKRADTRADTRAAGRARAAATLSAAPAEAAAPPWQALRRQLAQRALPMSPPASNLKEEIPPSHATWRLLPEGRPQPAGEEALGWLDELAAATGAWKPADTPPAQLRSAAWSVEWQAPGLGTTRLLMLDGQAWWRAPEGRWWQAGLPAEAAATLQRNARGLLAPPGAARPGSPN
jgi:hypothetical protein